MSLVPAAGLRNAVAAFLHRHYGDQAKTGLGDLDVFTAVRAAKRRIGMPEPERA